jgi:hypothetical protein
MPIQSGYQEPNQLTGAKGYYYYQYGNHGKKYPYDPKDPSSEQAAYQSAVRQAQAIHAHSGS